MLYTHIYPDDPEHPHDYISTTPTCWCKPTTSTKIDIEPLGLGPNHGSPVFRHNDPYEKDRKQLILWRSNEVGEPCQPRKKYVDPIDRACKEMEQCRQKGIPYLTPFEREVQKLIEIKARKKYVDPIDRAREEMEQCKREGIPYLTPSEREVLQKLTGK